VPVEVDRGLDRVVAELILHVRERLSALDQDRGVRVAKVMEADPTEPGLLEQRLRDAMHEVQRVDRLVDPVRKYPRREIAALNGGLGLLERFPALERSRKRGGKVHPELNRLVPDRDVVITSGSEPRKNPTKDSRHPLGAAADIKIPGLTSAEVAELAAQIGLASALIPLQSELIHTWTWGLAPPFSVADSMLPLSNQEREEVVKAWTRYAQCLKSRQFKLCFDLLSSRVLETWRRDHDVNTSESYAKIKGGEEIKYTDLQVLHVTKQDSSILVLARTRGVGEGGDFEGEKNFFFVKDGGKWRLDRIIEGTTEFLP